MKGYKIKVIQAKLDFYWYSTRIGEEFWSILEETSDSRLQYRVIIEGKVPENGNSTRWVDFDDCVIVKERFIRVDSEKFVSVVEI
jgi:hypothetical protein